MSAIAATLQVQRGTPSTRADLKVRVLAVLRGALTTGMTHDQIMAAVGPCYDANGIAWPEGGRVMDGGKAWAVAAAIDKSIDCGHREDDDRGISPDAIVSYYPIFYRKVPSKERTNYGYDHVYHAHLRAGDIPWQATDDGAVAYVRIGTLNDNASDARIARCSVTQVGAWYRAEVRSQRYGMWCRERVRQDHASILEILDATVAQAKQRIFGWLLPFGASMVTTDDLWTEMGRLTTAVDNAPAEAAQRRAWACEKRAEAIALLKEAEEQAACLRDSADGYDGYAVSIEHGVPILTARAGDIAAYVRRTL